MKDLSFKITNDEFSEPVPVITSKKSVKKDPMERGFNKIKVDNVSIKTTRADYEDIKDNNKYQQMDSFKVGQVIELSGRKWTIQRVTGDKRKLYHCTSQKGFKGTYDCLDLKRGVLIC